MSDIRLFFEIVGAITIIVSISSFFYMVACWILGIAPIVRRLGLGRWYRRVFIAAEGDSYSSLKTDLTDSGVFRERNINQITSKSLNKIKTADLTLVHYQSFTEDQIKNMINNKRNGAGLIFYFPEYNPPTNIVPAQVMKLMNSEPQTILVNMRGRLINDLLVTLLSTSYDKK